MNATAKLIAVGCNARNVSGEVKGDVRGALVVCWRTAQCEGRTRKAVVVCGRFVDGVQYCGTVDHVLVLKVNCNDGNEMVGHRTLRVEKNERGLVTITK